MEQHIGRYLKLDEEVHHINGNRQDNRIENLQLVTHAQHTRIHYRNDMSGRRCYNCNGQTYYDTKKGKYSWYNGSSEGQFECSRCHRDTFRRETGK